VNRFLIDTGPLVALLNRRDHHHAWSRKILDTIEPPIYTCEAVLSEACFLLGATVVGPDAALALIASDVVKVDFRIDQEIAALRHDEKVRGCSDVARRRMPGAHD